MTKDYFGEIEVDKPKKVERYKDYVGQKYSKWEVIKRAGTGKYLCRCECGYEAIKPIALLTGLGSMQCKKCYLSSVSHFMRKKGS